MADYSPELHPDNRKRPSTKVQEDCGFVYLLYSQFFNKYYMKKKLALFILLLCFFCSDSFALDRMFDRADTSSFPFAINSLSISGKSVALKKWSRKDPLSLNPDDNNVNIHFAKTNVQNSIFRKYLYKLEGWDKEWNEIAVNEDGFIIYSNLGGGDYTLKFKVSNKEKTEEEIKELLFIHVQFPYWRTWGFYTFYLLILSSYVFISLSFKMEASIREKEDKFGYERQLATTELLALRAQMNPHFIFNSLSTINKFILKIETAKASELVAHFSRLVRRILENSADKMVPLDREIELLNLYLIIESARFGKHFEHSIEVEEGVSVEMLKIPAMIIQPYIENAIWHGILHCDVEGRVLIRFFNKGGVLACAIEDNGVGYRASKKIKLEDNTLSKSYGMQITARRLALLSKKSTITILNLNDLDTELSGTRVEIVFSDVTIDEN